MVTRASRWNGVNNERRVWIKMASIRHNATLSLKNIACSRRVFAEWNADGGGFEFRVAEARACHRFEVQIAYAFAVNRWNALAEKNNNVRREIFSFHRIFTLLRRSVLADEGKLYFIPKRSPHFYLWNDKWKYEFAHGPASLCAAREECKAAIMVAQTVMISILLQKFAQLAV